MHATLITGASGGIGAAIAIRLAARKRHLILVARNESKLNNLAEQLRNEHAISVVCITADLSKVGAAQDLYVETRKRAITIDMLVNNAGIGSGGDFSELSLTSELSMLQLNISSLVALTHLYLQDMKAQKKGTIVNVASIASYLPLPYLSTYSASKAFVRHFTLALTEECKPYHVHVMLLSPGLTKTNFNEAAGIGSDLGKGLHMEYNASTQTADEVADELIKALDKRKHAIVTGGLNRLGARMSALLPNSFLARIFASSYRKRSK